MNEEKLFNQIEAYLAGDLSDVDKQAMEKEMATDTSLKTEVGKHQLAHQAMEVMIEANLKNSFEAWDAEGEAKVVGINRGAKVRTMYRRLAAAMSIILVLGFGLTWLVSGNYSNENLYQSHYNLPSNSGDRGVNPETTINQALDAYDKNNYTQSINILTTIPSGNDFYQKAQYYLGHAYIATNNKEAAIKAFQSSATGTDDNLREKAEWDLVLTLLNTNQLEGEMKSILDKIIADEGHSFHSSAVELKSELDSVLRKIFN